jgi:hypothetical protein
VLVKSGCEATAMQGRLRSGPRRAEGAHGEPTGSRDGEKASGAITTWRGRATHRECRSVQSGVRLMVDLGNTPAHQPGAMAQQRSSICSCTEARQ